MRISRVGAELRGVPQTVRQLVDADADLPLPGSVDVDRRLSGRADALSARGARWSFSAGVPEDCVVTVGERTSRRADAEEDRTATGADRQRPGAGEDDRALEEALAAILARGDKRDRASERRDRAVEVRGPAYWFPGAASARVCACRDRDGAPEERADLLALLKSRESNYVELPSMLRRVQFVALLELDGYGFIDLPSIRAAVPRADIRDLEAALQALIDEGSVEPTRTFQAIGIATRLAAVGGLELTDKGRQRIAEQGG